MIVSRLEASAVGGSRLSASRSGENNQQSFRIAAFGDSTEALEHGTRFSSTEFYGRSDGPNHAADDVGTLTIYQNGTAKWAAAGDTAGALVACGTGFVWMESASAGKGFCFCIVASDVAASSPSGTDHSVTVLPGGISGNIGYSSGGAVIWSQILSGFRMGITGLLGIGGRTTLDLVEMTGNVFEVDSHGRALTALPNIVYFSGSINDCTELQGSPGYTITDVLNRLTTIKNDVVSRGAHIIFASLSHEAPGTRRANMDIINAHYAAMAAANSSVHFCNNAALIDDIDGNAIAGSMDGPHYTPTLGAKICGETLNAILDTIAGTRQGRSSLLKNPSGNLLADGAFEGTSGVLTNATGVSAIDIYCGDGIVPIGDCSAVCSKEYVDGEPNPWQVITVTGGTEDSYVLALSPLSAIGDLLEAESEFYVSDSSMIGGGIIDAIRMSFFFYDSEGNPIEYLAGILAQCGEAGSLSGVLKTDVVTPPAGAVSAKLAWLSWKPAGNNVVVKIRNAVARIAS